MKVCHLTSVHDYRDTRILLKECVSLKDAGYDVHLIAPNTENLKYKEVQIIGVQRKKQNRIQRIFNSTSEFYQTAIRIDADIYHFHDPELIPLGKKLSKAGKKVIYDVHEDVPRQIMTKHWIPELLKKPISWIFEKYENNATNKFSAVVTSTPFIKERFEKFHSRVVDIKNYPLLNELYFGDKQKTEKKNIVTYIGGISEGRGLYTTLEALKKIPDVELKLAGKFGNNKTYDTAKSIESWKKVDFLGFVDRNQIKEILSSSKVGLVVLHPKINFIDSLPIKMFEYMAAGIPVIASNFPLWEDIINKNKCGICVDPLNVKEITEAIQWIFDNPEEAKKMGENGRKAVEDKYNWEEESKKLIALYNNILK